MINATHWATPSWLVTLQVKDAKPVQVSFSTWTHGAFDDPKQGIRVLSVVREMVDYDALLHCAARCGWQETR